MPIPIKPVHSLDLHAELFDGPSMEGLGLSDIQIQMLGISNAPKKEASVKLSDKYITMLKAIDQNNFRQWKNSESYRKRQAYT